MVATDAVAQAILHGFDRHYRIFRETSSLAKMRWEAGDWTSIADAGRLRIDMYDLRVAEAVETIKQQFPDAGQVEAMWPAIKRAFIGLIYEHKQPECAETFYNSVARRVLDRRYYRNEYIFGRPVISTEHLDGADPTYRCYYPEDHDLRPALREAIAEFQLASPFADLERDLAFVQRAILEHYPNGWERRPNFQVHVLRSLFFRNKGAYIVGRVVNGDAIFPLLVPLIKDPEGRICIDTVLLDKKSIGRVMNLGRTYFFVDMEVPSAYVTFLESIVPSRTKSELYMLLGLGKQGKTLLFRDLEQHLRHSTDKFVIAPGTKGMVMLVFTLPSFPYVFKVIRDWFAPPKDTDRSLVEERYRYVKRHDRVGRMSDTLEFAHVAFPRARFDAALLEELEKKAPSSLELDGERLVIKHFYIEWRLTPLDIFVREAEPGRAVAAVREYGRAVKELAGANIFPGDLLLKNFGMTRYNRVVFYDYDELCEVTDCRFRALPKASNQEEELSAEPFFNVDAADVFPEQFPQFLFPVGPLRDAFLEEHPELASPSWWNAQKGRLHQGVQEDMFAYGPEVRFSNRYHGSIHP